MGGPIARKRRRCLPVGAAQRSVVGAENKQQRTAMTYLDQGNLSSLGESVGYRLCTVCGHAQGLGPRGNGAVLSEWPMVSARYTDPDTLLPL
mgnify:CR=1 FL=1